MICDLHVFLGVILEGERARQDLSAKAISDRPSRKADV